MGTIYIDNVLVYDNYIDIDNVWNGFISLQLYAETSRGE